MYVCVFSCAFACVRACIRAFPRVECVFAETRNTYMYLVYLLTYPHDIIIECQTVRVEKTLYMYTIISYDRLCLD